jgi:pimeloyl-ACP methyl ester carboxylesterase
VVEAIGEPSELVVVGHSLGAFTAQLVCARIPVDLLVLVAGMIPAPGETASDWWANTRYPSSPEQEKAYEEDPIGLFYSDVPSELAAEAATKWRDEAAAAMGEPWPLAAWPDVPTRFLLCRDDRVLPADWLRGVVRERLGIAPEEIDGGHCPFLSRPAELAERLIAQS